MRRMEIFTILASFWVFLSAVSYSKEQDKGNLIDYFYPMEEKSRPKLNAYEYWKTYLNAVPDRKNPVQPRDHCPGFQCPQSALRVDEKKMWNRAYNYFYDLYSTGASGVVVNVTGWKESNLNRGVDSFSNIFYKTWDDDLSEYAQQKAALCLPVEQNHESWILLDDTPIQAKWHKNPGKYPNGSTCGVEIQVQTYTLHYGHTIRPCYDKFPAQIEAPVYVRRLTSMARHATAYAMGCGTVTRIEGTTLMRHTVCYFCPSATRFSSYNKDGSYLPKPGPVCSGCNDYSKFLSDIKCTRDLPDKFDIFNSTCYANKSFNSEWKDGTYPECYPCEIPPSGSTPITTENPIKVITFVKAVKEKSPKTISCTRRVFIIHFLLILCTFLLTGCRYLGNHLYGTSY